jgi:UDP-2,3-diacylglucosamine pyrophosphatase LpxH
MQEGIFSSEKLAPNTVEFCIISDVHIANDEGDTSRAFTKQSRNDYVFASNRAQTPISGEAYTLKRFCEKVNWSGRLGHFDDGQHVLVLLGDIINGECGYFASYHSTAYKMLSASFLPWVHTGNVIYVAGNHDKDARFYSTLTNFPRLSVVEDGFTKCGIIFKHGHQFDFLCNGRNANVGGLNIGILGEFASNVVVKLFPPDIEDIMRGRGFYYDHSSTNSKRDLRSLPEQATLQTMSNENKRVVNGAFAELRKQKSCHTIVCGHTHQSPIRIDLEEPKTGRHMTYFNTGKFAKDGYLNVVAKLVDARTDTWGLL